MVKSPPLDRLPLLALFRPLGEAFAVLLKELRPEWPMGRHRMAETIVENVSLQELKQGLMDGSIVLIDIREQNEWDAGHIPGAAPHPLSAFDPAALPRAEPGKRVVLHCRSGRRTLAALEAAQAAGRDDITTHFGGGMLAWVGAGEEVA